MDGKTIVELIGYLGSALVVVSMLMTSVVKLRIVNTIGSAIFTGYAFVIGSYPTALMNLFLIGINAYQLFRLLRTQKRYDLISTDLQDQYVQYFLEKSMDDIHEWFPEFSMRGLRADVVYLVCCDSNPAGIFIGKHLKGPDVVEVLLDYAAPVYRDTSAGRYLHEQMKQKGCKTLVFRSTAPKHVKYMEKVGYQMDEKGAYVLRLKQ